MPPAGKQTFQISIYELQTEQRSVRKRGVEVQLTPTEYDILEKLMTSTNHPVSHANLLNKSWGAEYQDERE